MAVCRFPQSLSCQPTRLCIIPFIESRATKNQCLDAVISWRVRIIEEILCCSDALFLVVVVVQLAHFVVRSPEQQRYSMLACHRGWHIHGTIFWFFWAFLWDVCVTLTNGCRCCGGSYTIYHMICVGLFLGLFLRLNFVAYYFTGRNLYKTHVVSLHFLIYQAAVISPTRANLTKYC